MTASIHCFKVRMFLSAPSKGFAPEPEVIVIGVSVRSYAEVGSAGHANWLYGLGAWPPVPNLNINGRASSIDEMTVGPTMMMATGTVFSGNALVETFI